jgi:phage terminase large subunit-like protein
MLMTKPYAQVLTASTMGTDESEPLNKAVERGRSNAEMGMRSGTAYFEWSADEGDDPDDPIVWRRCMPALGYTLTEEVVRHARTSMSLPEFRRAFLNIKDGRKSDNIIPMDKWNDCADVKSGPVGAVALSFDVSPDRSSGAVAIAGDAAGGGGLHVEVVDHRPGTGWMVERIAAIAERNSVSSVACDPAGPAGGLLGGLQAKGIEVRLLGTREHTQACGALFDNIVNKRIRHLDQPVLNAAIDGADRRQVNDAWLWSRKGSNVDICPLVAVTLACAAHTTREKELAPLTAETLGLY